MKECKCQDWLENIAKVNAPINLMTLRTGHAYSGLVFKYCPWCKAELVVPDDEKPTKLETEDMVLAGTPHAS